MIDKLPWRERQIFDALCMGTEMTAADLQAAIPDAPSNSATRILLSRLEKKGYVSHRVVKGKYVYSVAARREGVSVGPFSVDKTHVTALDDVLLRELLGKLIEAEASTCGIPLCGIDLGGSQNAPDGGIDAALEWSGPPEPSGWLPRRTIFYQCKAQVLRPAQIKHEMRPKGELRPIFSTLVQSDGAYIIFSTDDIGLGGQNARLAQMRSELRNLPASEKIHVDFLGADRIARWVNQHLGVALWLLAKNGRALGGWRPFGSWSSPESAETPYLIDEAVRASTDGRETDVRSGITAMRGALATYGGCVRLVGISGMGKTRLAEALFDSRVAPGKAPSASLAIYADAGHEIAVGAALIAEQLVLSRVEAVLVVDNCAARTHSQLAEIVRRKGSRVSLLTIDYDVGDAQPDGTLVVRLGGNSEGLLLSLLEQRHPQLSEGERHHLARFSEGNARVALAIARGLSDGVNLATLSDDELLERLFQAGRAENGVAVRRTAAAAALTYAFHADRTEGTPIEHPVLAQLAGLTSDDFYRHVQMMLDWGIAQQRGPQRAIKPDPIANRLARKMLRESDPEALLATFRAGPERLFASFARRVGQLHDLPAAMRIASQLLSVGEWLGDPNTQNDLQQRAFSKIAPASPEGALHAIERALVSSTPNPLINSAHRRRELAELLAHLAYDDGLFLRAMEALLKLALAEIGDRDTQVRDLFLQRFWPALSRTLAKADTRLQMIDRLLDDDLDGVRALGVEALDHMLDTWHLSSSFNPEFGSQLRNKEWRPRGRDYLDWIEAAYRRLERAAVSGEPEAKRARHIVAQHLREHLESGFGERAVQAMRRVHSKGYWDKGWRATNDALHFSGKKSAHARAMASTLENELRPKTVDECFEAFVLGEPWRHWHPSGRENASVRNVALLAKAVGAKLTSSGRDLSPFLKRGLSAQGQTSVFPFGEGLGSRASDLPALWREAYGIYAAIPEDNRNPGVLIGLLQAGERKGLREWVDARLDAAMLDPLLKDYAVHLHGVRDLGASDVERLIVALEQGGISAERLGALMYGGATGTIPAADLARLLNVMITRPGGAIPALQVLYMRCHYDKQAKRASAPELLAAARYLLVDRRCYESDRDRVDHELAGLARLVFAAGGGTRVAVGICRALRALARRKRYWSMQEMRELAALLMKTHPRVVLDEIVLTADRDSTRDLAGVFFGGWSADADHRQGRERTPLDVDLTMNWVAEDPQPRARRLAQLIPYADSPEGGALEWSAIALGLIEMAPDPLPILDVIEDRFSTGVSSGPFSSRYVRRRPLVAALMHHRDRRVRNWARDAGERIESSIKRWDKIDRESDSRFE